MRTDVRQTTELFTSVPNRPGAIAELTMPLQQRSINIEAIYAYEKDPSTTALHFITSDNVKAMEFLVKNGFTVVENQVVCWNATNSPGILYRASAALAEKRINISYVYGGAGVGSGYSLIVFNTTNNKETVGVLSGI